MIKPIKTHSEEMADALQNAGWKLVHRIVDSEEKAYEFVLEWPHAYPPPERVWQD